MTRVVVCLDKFRGSATAAQASRACADGIRSGLQAAGALADVVEIPVADGGEGTVDVLVAAGYERRTSTVEGPLGDSVEADTAVSSRRVVVEMAQASGLWRVGRRGSDGAARPALLASTYGTGQLVGQALQAGPSEIVVTAGGSASTDGGAGLLQALGARLTTSTGHELPRGGAALASLVELDLAHLDPRLAAVRIVLASDVDNPLVGPTGAAAVFAPQKGADRNDVAILERALTHWADLLAECTGVDHRDAPGAGAAGGLGVAVLAALAGTRCSGIEFVMEECGVSAAVVGADLVVVGEGRLDAQSLGGKAPSGVAALARRAGVPVVAVAGRVELSSADARRAGIGACFATLELARDEADSCRRVLELLGLLGQRIGRAAGGARGTDW